MNLQCGRLKIIDRKKHIFKLSQGEYIAPEKIENVLLGGSQLVEQIFVDGNSLHPFTVALIYPNCKALEAALGIPLEKLLNGKGKIGEDKILEELQKVGKANQLNSFEIPKKIMILKEPFSLENGCLTPTQKIKREEVRMKFKGDLENLYKNA